VVTPGDVGLRSVGFVRWDDRLEPKTGSAGPAPGSGAIEVPGRPPLPVRTRLEPAGGAAALVGRIVDPDGQPRPVIVRLGPGNAELIDVDEPPQALAARSDGAWSLGREQLTAVASGGAVLTRAGVSGIRALSAPADAAWVCGVSSCAYVTATGSLTGFRSPWRDGFDACLDGESLTGWDPDEPGGVVSLDPTGDIRRRHLGVDRAPFERPLVFGNQEVLSAALRTLVHRGPSGERSITMTGAGLTTDGVPFFAGQIENRSWLWLGDAPPITLEAQSSDQVLAVSNGRVLVRSGAITRWRAVTSQQPDADDVVVDKPEAIIALGWTQDDPYPFVAAENGELLVAASGPDGVVVLGLRWPASP
jgi:hypothetical protein